jgi:hypothetical protein
MPSSLAILRWLQLEYPPFGFEHALFITRLQRPIQKTAISNLRLPKALLLIRTLSNHNYAHRLTSKLSSNARPTYGQRYTPEKWLLMFCSHLRLIVAFALFLP